MRTLVTTPQGRSLATMLDLSRHSVVHIDCPCGETVDVLQWDVVDARHRLDLVKQAQQGLLAPLRCPSCAREHPRGPLALITGLTTGPLVLVFSAQGTAHESGEPAWFAPMYASLEGERRTPVIHLDSDQLAILAPRDLGADLLDPGSAVDAVAREYGDHLAQEHANFLAHLRKSLAAEPRFVALNELNGVTNREEFAALIESAPVLLDDETLAYLEHLASVVRNPDRHYDALVSLLRTARSDAQQAWADYEQHAIDLFSLRGVPVRAQLAELRTLVDSKAHHKVAALAQQVIDGGVPLSDDDVGFVHYSLGCASLELAKSDASYTEGYEIAVRAFEVSLPAASVDMRPRVLMNLAVSYSKRSQGARRDNLARAIALIEEVIATESSFDDNERAMAHTNLAYFLQLRSGPLPGDLLAARDHCEIALRWRRPDVDADQWAYTQVNLGVALAGLVDFDHVAVDEARAANEAVVAHEHEIADKSLVAQAMLNVAQLETRVATADADGEHPDEPLRLWHLSVARETLLRAIALWPAGTLDQGRALRLLAEVLVRLELDDEALAAYRGALDILTPASDPNECQLAGSGLGALYAERSDWPHAAEAFRTALQAAEFDFHRCLDTTDRHDAVRRAGNLNRWAAYTIARTGQLREAAEVLENGRTRELRRRMAGETGEVERLRVISPELHDEYVAASHAMRSAPLADVDAAGRAMQEVLMRIREQPALRGFGLAVGFDQIVTAAVPETPLLYLDPTPYGTVCLLVRAESDEPESLFIETTSRDLIYALMYGRGDGTPSYFAVLLKDYDDEDERERELHAALDFTLPWVGEHLLRPIAETFAATEMNSIAIVVSGPLAALPLAPCSWRDGGNDIALVDVVDLGVAPSATIQATCLRRAARRRDEPFLVAIANPQGPGPDELVFAEPEVDQIARSFPTDNQVIARCDDATSEFLRRHAAKATHLHLACHAKSDMVDARRSCLVLADGDITLANLAATFELECRLAVASACETGQLQISEATDEFFSTGVMMLGMGAAGAIASQWSIDDWSTALLMTRFYETLGDALVSSPANALRAAQLWLRSATWAEIDAYLADRPDLAADLHRRRSLSAAMSINKPNGDGDVPFAHPDYWGAFVLYGA